MKKLRLLSLITTSILLIILISAFFYTNGSIIDALEPNLKSSDIEDVSRHWSTFTSLSINVDSNHGSPAEEFFLFVDTPNYLHTIIIDPDWWAAMEGRITPKIGLEVRLLDPMQQSIIEDIIPYESSIPCTYEFTPEEYGYYVLVLIEAYGDATLWGSEFGWELGNVKLDFIGFHNVYSIQDEINMGFARFRCTGISYSCFIRIEENQETTIDFSYLGSCEADSTSSLNQINIYNKEEVLLESFDLTTQYAVTATFDLPQKGSVYRVEVMEKVDRVNAGYIFTFKKSEYEHMPIYLANLDGKSPEFSAKSCVEDFEEEIPTEYDFCTITSGISFNNVYSGSASYMVNYSIPNDGGGWFELKIIRVDNPLDFTNLSKLSIWVYNEGNHLNFYIYLNNARWGDSSNTWLDFYGAMFSITEFSHIGWQEIQFCEDDFNMVQFDSFDFSHVESISLGINAADVSVNGVICFDSFEADIFGIPEKTITTQTPTTTSSWDTNDIPHLTDEIPGYEILVTVIAITMIKLFLGNSKKKNRSIKKES